MRFLPLELEVNVELDGAGLGSEGLEPALRAGFFAGALEAGLALGLALEEVALFPRVFMLRAYG